MTTRPLTVIFLGGCLLSLGACKKEAESQPPAAEASEQGGGEGGGEGGGGGGGGEAAAEEILTVDGFEETMQTKQGEVADCFAAAKEADPKLAGKLALEVTIGGDGVVTGVTFGSNSTIKDPKITSCVEEKAKGWKFPKTRKGEPMTFPYALNLS